MVKERDENQIKTQSDLNVDGNSVPEKRPE